MLLLLLSGCTDEPVVGTGTSAARRLSTPPRVLLVGDSIMDEHGSHARMALRAMGIDAQVLGAWGSCLFTREQYDCDRVQMHANGSGFSWLDRATALVRDVDPDLVVIYLNHNYGPEPPRSAEQCRSPEEDSIAVGSPEFELMAQRLLREFVRRLSIRNARVLLVKPLPVRENEPAAENPFFKAYLGIQEELGFGVVDASEQLISENGGRIETVADCDGLERRVRPKDDVHLTYFGAGLMGTALARAVARELHIDGAGVSAPAERPVTLLAADTGYRVVTCDSAVFAFGSDVPNAGGAAFSEARPRARPVVGAAATTSGEGYVQVFSNGQVLAFGDAAELGSLPEERLAGAEVRGIAYSANDAGYWVALSNGEVHAIGAAAVLGNMPISNDSVTAIAAAAGGEGYWLVTANGQVGAFGSAVHFGDLAGSPPSHAVVGIAPHPRGGGYWLLDRAGNVFPFGDARQRGGAAGQDLRIMVDHQRYITKPVTSDAKAVAIAATSSGDGYRIALDNGAVCHFGDASRLGSLYRTFFNGMLVWLNEPFYAATSSCQ
ncbi:MAG TPA: hypothetical protein VK524_30630 [Polyangiaceae bacterium]|nr:hypothetical protein [Polyangiaceae bacterium]